MTKKNAKKNDKIRVAPTTMRLPVKLNDDDLITRGKQLVENMRKTAMADEAREVENKKRKGDIALLGEVTAKLSTIVSSGTEDREVDCEVSKDFIHGKVTTVRMDTGEVVDERVMTAEERQDEFSFEGATSADTREPEERQDEFSFEGATSADTREPKKGKDGDPFGEDEASDEDGDRE
jgi:hypothetical protein